MHGASLDSFFYVHWRPSLLGRATETVASVQDVFSGVFPVKCNHDRGLLECILEAGRPFDYGLEVGSKAELLMAMSMIGRSPGALLICNGYKDAAFIRLVR